MERITLDSLVKSPGQDFIEFEMIWNDYFNIMPMECYEFDIYIKIIQKIRKGDLNFAEDKERFIELTDIIADTIYRYKKRHPSEDYHENKEYLDTEINCCRRVKKHLIHCSTY